MSEVWSSRAAEGARAPLSGGAPQGLIADLAPRTFFERGVSVPFTTPVLIQARVRAAGQNEIEFVLPNFSEGRGRYVMPWAAIRSFAVTTVHDRQLAARLEPRWVHSPAAVRELALQVAGRGLAGPAAARAAREALLRDDGFITMLKCHLVMMVAEAAGVSVQDLWASGFGGSPDEQERTRWAMARVEAVLGVKQSLILDRIEKLGTLLAPVGLIGLPQNGRLRALLDRLFAMAEHLAAVAERGTPELARLAHFEQQMASLTCALAIETLSCIDAIFDTPATMIGAWESRIAELTRLVLRLQHLLDGWDYLAALWDGAGERGTDLSILVTESFRLLPVIPRAEVELADDHKLEELAGVQRRWVRAHQDWRSGRLDMAQVRRAEGIKARSLASGGVAALGASVGYGTR